LRVDGARCTREEGVDHSSQARGEAR
jgi:hypothetical protein